MSAFKGTPGPWGPHPWAHACVISSDEILIANCGGHASNMRDQGELIAEQEANARLIAVAPEMLEVLEHVRDAMEASGGWDGDEHVFELVVAAIAKAVQS